MLTIESTRYEIENLPPSLRERMGKMGLTISHGPSSERLDNICLRINGPTIDECSIELDSDTLPAEICGWIIPGMVQAVEIFTAEKDSPYSQMELRA